MRKPCFLGIDTSNYTTSLAFCTEAGEIVANLKLPLPVKEGERGLRQSDAVFLHTKNLPPLFQKAKVYFAEYQPIAIGVSAYPRTVEGSYMPCFLAGVATAEALAVSHEIPCFTFSHQNGHIMAALASSGTCDTLIGKEFAAFHVSGGTTEVLLVHPCGEDFRCEIVGGTLDINAGQAIDRVGVALGLSFPCGAALEKLALAYEGKPKRKKGCVKDGYCNLSGLENMALDMLKKGAAKEEIAAFVLSFVGETLVAMTSDLRAKYSNISIVYSGGVMSCSILKKMLAGDGCYFAEPQFSSDNAAGIAHLTRRAFLKA
ncbi:MAG: peptidase M22 [Ruminococcaceae bacterium]|nr:peptidase M22 [Oscillospiraceae bacterium]